MGELLDMLNPALSSAPRADDVDPATRCTETGVYRHNETLLLLHLLAYQILHMGRTR